MNDERQTEHAPLRRVDRRAAVLVAAAAIGTALGSAVVHDGMAAKRRRHKGRGRRNANSSNAVGTGAGGPGGAGGAGGDVVVGCPPVCVSD
jgi:hypothetical protein